MIHWLWLLFIIIPVSLVVGFIVSAILTMGACADCRDERVREMAQVRADEFGLGFEAGLRAEKKPGWSVWQRCGFDLREESMINTDPGLALKRRPE